MEVTAELRGNARRKARFKAMDTTGLRVRDIRTVRVGVRLRAKALGSEG